MTQESTEKLDLSKVIREHLENVKNYMIFQMEAYGRNASGRHVKGLNVTALPAYGLLSSEEPWNYPVNGESELAPVIECGRGGAESTPSRPNFPENFQGIIRQWILDKGLPIEPIPYLTNREHKYTPEERGLNSMAYLISRKIMKEGTALHRSGVREDIYSSAINREVAAIEKESRMRVSEVISNINKNAL